MELQLRGITKRFPGVLANDRVDLTVRPGEILGLLGENGAGKTTLMNILYGLYSADEGEILVDGVPRTFSGPGDAIAAGIGMVHQHFMLVPVFTVTENVVLGVEPTRGPGIINMRQARRDVAEISSKYGLEVDPDALIESIPVGVQQRVEIIKVLFRDAEVLVFDEPTAVLTPQEVEEFFGILRGLRDAGKAIVFITHKLKEVLEISDRICVLRRGRTVGERAPGEVDEATLAEMMVGRPVELVVQKAPARPGEVVLEVDDLMVFDDRDHPRVKGVTMSVRAGEIVGVAGVQGNGQTELVEALTGMRHPFSGAIRVLGEVVTRESPRGYHQRHVAHVPEDRQRAGLVLGFTVAENLILDSYYGEPFSHWIRMDWDAIRGTGRRLVEEYDIRTPSIEIPVSNLSGGNQQKVIVAREFSRDVRLIIASQPTRGLDVGSIEYIHERIIRQRDTGAAVVIVSTELDEVMALADRLLVMFGGRIVADLDPTSVTSAQVGLYMAGATP
ncbi:MAG: heme ABC transporter ATP-binding protein [Actinobacteria bacterium RBG_16_68_21]|nr:MAG: heme ABC transporter ATP-binding protein [Actinobacteria bacterium RBG_16_68_21]